MFQSEGKGRERERGSGNGSAEAAGCYLFPSPSPSPCPPVPSRPSLLAPSLRPLPQRRLYERTDWHDKLATSLQRYSPLSRPRPTHLQLPSRRPRPSPNVLQPREKTGDEKHKKGLLHIRFLRFRESVRNDHLLSTVLAKVQARRAPGR